MSGVVRVAWDAMLQGNEWGNALQNTTSHPAAAMESIEPPARPAASCAPGRATSITAQADPVSYQVVLVHGTAGLTATLPPMGDSPNSVMLVLPSSTAPQLLRAATMGWSSVAWGLQHSAIGRLYHVCTWV